METIEQISIPLARVFNASLLVADATFQEAKSDCLEQLTNGNNRTNQYTTCKSVQLVITSC